MIVDPDNYRVKVASLPRVSRGRYIDVQFSVFYDDEEVGTINEWFDVEQPKKLINFLEAIGQPHSTTERFNITPSRWHNAECDVLVLLKEWQDETGQTKQRNILLEFSPC